ncbi:MAG: hypothetical protein HXN77_08915 [Prevotella pallens]|jgi:hypothetical protein|uniref:hypothetical protein n=1 Tax=Prevotella pallens TaxID=60133 RepID=UPI001CB553AC|nr:hypothetical protein [Prevotella pallens]MBF1490603.1 hypothetical protein [Prevotella pallens]
MKIFGSVFEYEQERNNNLLRLYHQLISEVKFICSEEIYRKMADSPSDRFWVSEERALIVVLQIMKGDTLLGMGKNKRDMFFEIYRRATIMKQKYPTLSLTKIMFKVVRQPAPKFYLTEGSIKVIISKIKSKWYERRRVRNK